MAPAMHNIDRDQVRRAPYGVYPDIPEAQQQALIEHALELGGPPGRVIARTIPTTTEGHTVEVLIGWERLAAFTHKDVYPHAPTLPLGLIDCNAADAAFYAIEYASLDQKAAGLVTSPLLYAAAAEAAIEHFSQPEAPWTIQETANALCIARPTLSNRLRLLKGLTPKTRELLQQGLIKAEFAKILLAEPSPKRQEHLATRVARGMMSTRVLYKLVHPGYEAPQTIAAPRGRKLDRLGNIGAMERELAERFGSPTTITLDNKQQKGVVEMEYHSLSELTGLLEHLKDSIQTDTLLRGSLSLKVDNAREANALLLELGSNTDPNLG
jgi:hypothetical protein